MTTDRWLGLVTTEKASTWVPLLLLLIAAPLFAIILTSAFSVRTEQEAELYEEAIRWLINIEDEQKHVFGEAGRALSALIDTGVGAMSPAQCATVLARLRTYYPRHFMFTVTDANGVIRCSTEPLALGHSIADRSTFQQAHITDGIIQGLSRPSEYSGKPMIPLVRRYVDDAGRFAGTVNAVIDTAWLEDLLQRKPLPPHASLLIADRAGTLFARAPEGSAPPGGLPEFLHPLLGATQREVTDIDDGQGQASDYGAFAAGSRREGNPQHPEYRSGWQDGSGRRRDAAGVKRHPELPPWRHEELPPGCAAQAVVG
ncbi:PDC sensor domain-containing protein [Azospirillum argentinense]|uniref:PDC sensor domain-containing protein n=1 Tax=Azospirillum argentinense TaxID=2970906 RepID=UPI0011AFA248|nr:hypothetical protein [Azospirillum argentinense]